MGNVVGRDYPDKNRQYDSETLAVMKRLLREDDNCVDVGAHRGSMLNTIVERAPRGRHYAFEPLPDFCHRLDEQYPDVVVCNVALSDRRGNAEFNYVHRWPGYSGLRKRDYPGDDAGIETIQVEVDLLDNIIPPGMAIRFMKIDVEGGELGVFRGAARILRESRPVVVFEYGLGAAEYYEGSPGDLWKLLVQECGMRISLMKRWLRDEAFFSEEEFLDQFRRGLNFYFIAY